MGIRSQITFLRLEFYKFGKGYLPSDSHINTIISDRLTRQDVVKNRDKVYFLNKERSLSLLKAFRIIQ